MVTLLQLQREQVWQDEVVPAASEAFLISCRAHFSLSAGAVGAKGDENHLKGRHRSRNWDLQSAYCTNRGYGTTDARDQHGDGDWIRANDIGVQGSTLRAVSRRVDRAVRAGELPEVAEWFGTFDGVSVAGWFQGHPATSDESHLFHFHLGIWTEHANDAAFYRRLFAVVTGTPTTGENPTMRYTFAADLPGIPDGVAGRVHATDGVRYRVVPSSFQVGNLMDAAGAGPVVDVTRAKLPTGWTYAQAVGALCGTLDPGELAGSGGTAPPIDLSTVEAAAFDGGKAGAKAGLTGATVALSGSLSGSMSGTIAPGA